MENKLFSGKSFLVSLKGLGSNIVTALSSIPLWGLSVWFARNDHLAVAMIFSALTLAWFLFFWGYISRVMWKWD